MTIPTPPVLTKAFAQNAGGSFIQNPIPDATATPGRASYDQGFPPETMQPVTSGGIPPFGQDVNGILYAVSSHAVWAQGGQLYLWNADVAAAFSPAGYPVGTILGSTDGTTVWCNQTAANSTDPDAGGAGWVPLFSYGYSAITGLTGGIVTVTNAQARRGVLVLTGTLAANLQLVLPATLRSWLIVNSTTGDFTTIVKTASGTGVTVPKGGFGSPVGVYGDGTNIYPTVSPLVLPLSVAPSPNTIVQRDASSQVYAALFNSAGALSNPTLTGVFAESGSDGWIRKTSVANLSNQMILGDIGGTVLNSQVPQSAVTQHKAAVLASAALTGTPTTPTAAAGTSTTQVASTAFVQQNQPKVASCRVITNVLQAGSRGVDGVVRNGVGDYTIDITSAGFTQLPSAVVSLQGGITADRVISATVVSATSVRIRAYLSFSLFDSDFNLIVAGV